jgi:hypothetical protein
MQTVQQPTNKSVKVTYFLQRELKYATHLKCRNKKQSTTMNLTSDITYAALYR